MNMYKHSQTSNWQMGVKYSKEEDHNHFNNTRDEILRINDACTRESAECITPKTNLKSQNQTGIKPSKRCLLHLKIHQKKGLPDTRTDSIFGEAGYCVRCGDVIDYHPEKPFCEKCYQSWAKFNNPSYREKYCHICGEKASTTKV